MRETLKDTCQSELIIKKSRFIAQVLPIENRQDAIKFVQDLKKQHVDARHICWAMIADGQAIANDDGEPSGTAGRPMLQVLQRQHLDNVMAAVVRYFGGIKLGAGGLLRAYTEAVALALRTAQRQVIEKTSILSVVIHYEHENVIRHLLEQSGVVLMEVQYFDQVQLKIQVVDAQCAQLCDSIESLTKGRGQCSMLSLLDK